MKRGDKRRIRSTDVLAAARGLQNNTTACIRTSGLLRVINQAGDPRAQAAHPRVQAAHLPFTPDVPFTQITPEVGKALTPAVDVLPPGLWSDGWWRHWRVPRVGERLRPYLLEQRKSKNRGLTSYALARALNLYGLSWLHTPALA